MLTLRVLSSIPTSILAAEILQHTSTSILADTTSTLQHTATRSNTLQNTTTHYVHHLSVNRWMDEFIHTMIYIHIHIYISISTYETCITSSVACLNGYPTMYVFVMPSCVHLLVCVCVCVGVCVFCRCIFHCRCADQSAHLCLCVGV